MTPERQQQAEDLYHSVRQRAMEERAALLAGPDPEIRQEVEALLRREDDGLATLGLPKLGLPPIDAHTITMTQGARLGPYQLETKLGQGGMGEVFRAIDTRLGRAVAIKIVDQRFTSRFEREARAISFAQSSSHLHAV